MYHMVMLVLNDMDDCTPVVEAWEATGVGGITIVETAGLGNARKAGMRGGALPMMPSITDFMRGSEQRHRTIFTVVDSDERVDELIEVSQRVLGDMEQPDNGVLFVLPVSRALGVSGGQQRAGK